MKVFHDRDDCAGFTFSATCSAPVDGGLDVWTCRGRVMITIPNATKVEIDI